MRPRDIAAVAADPLRKIRVEDIEAEFPELEPLIGDLSGLIGLDWVDMGPEERDKRFTERLGQLEQSDREQVFFLAALAKQILLRPTLESLQIWTICVASASRWGDMRSIWMAT